MQFEICIYVERTFKNFVAYRDALISMQFEFMLYKISMGENGLKKKPKKMLTKRTD